MSHQGNYNQNPYSGGVPGWGEPPMHQGGPQTGTMQGYWGPRGQHYRSFEHRGSPGQSPSPRQSPRGQFTPMYSSSPFMQQTPHQQHRMNHRGGGSARFGGRYSEGNTFTSPHRHSPGQGRNNGGKTDISSYYKHSMVEDPWKGLIATPVTTGT